MGNHESRLLDGLHGAVEAIVEHSVSVQLHLFLLAAEDAVLGHLVELVVSGQAEVGKRVGWRTYLQEPSLDLVDDELVFLSSYFDVVGLDVCLGLRDQLIQQLRHLLRLLLLEGRLSEQGRTQQLEVDVQLHRAVCVQDHLLMVHLFELRVLLLVREFEQVGVQDFDELLVLRNDCQVFLVELVDYLPQRHFLLELQQQVLQARGASGKRNSLQHVLHYQLEEEAHRQGRKGAAIG